MKLRSLFRVPTVGLSALLGLGLVACDDETENKGSEGGGGGSASTVDTTASTTSSQSTGTLEQGAIDTSWTIAIQHEARDCFWAGASWVDVAFEDEAGNVETARFACDAVPAAGSHPVAPGSYTVTATLTSFAEEPVVSAAAVDVVVAPGEAAPLPIAFDIPGGRFAVGWTITKDEVAATCKEVGAHRVELMAIHESGTTYGNTWECPLAKGTSDAFPLGTYEVVVSLLYEQDVVLVSSDIIDTALVDAGITVGIETVEFAFTTPPDP